MSDKPLFQFTRSSCVIEVKVGRLAIGWFTRQVGEGVVALFMGYKGPHFRVYRLAVGWKLDRIPVRKDYLV